MCVNVGVCVRLREKTTRSRLFKANTIETTMYLILAGVVVVDDFGLHLVAGFALQVICEVRGEKLCSVCARANVFL